MFSAYKKQIIHLGLLLIMGSMWGLQFAMLKLAAGEGLGEIGILTYALAALSVIFLIITAGMRKLFIPNLSQMIYFIIGSFFGYIVPLGVILYISHNLSAGMITLMASLTPVVTIFLALVFRTEIVSKGRIIALLLGIIACLLVLYPELGSWGESNLGWLLLGMIIPLAYGIDGVYISKFWPEELDSLQVVTAESIVAFLLMTPMYLIFAEPIHFEQPWTDLSWTDGQLGMFWFVMGGVVEVMLFFYLIRNAGPVLVSFGSLISLFAGIGWGIVLFDEAHGLIVWLAVALLCISLAFASVNAKPAEDQVEEPV